MLVLKQLFSFFKECCSKISKVSKIDCLRFVMCPLLAPVLICFFLLLLLTVLMKQTRQAVHAVKQSTLLRCLWFQCQCYETVFGIIDYIISVFTQDFDKGYAESK
jgi:hypothetical protein